MIISRTPFRISLFGGGTDYPAWYREHGGEVLAATFDKYCYLACRHLPPFFEHKYRVVWSKTETCRTIEETRHPAVRTILGYMGIERGVEIHHVGDLPARSGMGSSSSFSVGLLHALHALKGEMPHKHRLALEAIHVEQDLLRETVGSQDQISSAYGGLNHIVFLPNGEISVRPVTICPERLRELDDRLMLFYTGIKRTASNVAKSYVTDLNRKRRVMRIMKDLVREAMATLTGRGDLAGLGDLLDEAWQAKRSLGKTVSNPRVDALYDLARSAGARGGKLTGAGGGGFLLLFVEPDRRPAVREALQRLVHVPFALEFSGSQIIFFDPEQDYASAEADRAARPIDAFRELNDLVTVEGLTA
jgi:D-glycero-alpha-D-manno-heptose-7-phosphate kinase